MQIDFKEKKEKRKKMRNVIAIILSLVLTFNFLAGCSNNVEKQKDGNWEQKQSEENNGEEKGRFIESECDLPKKVDSILNAAKCSDDSVEAVGYNEESRQLYLIKSSDQGESWKTKQLDNLIVYNYSATAIADNGAVALFGIFESGSGKTGLRIISKKGSISTVPLNLPEYKSDANTENQILDAVYAGRNLLAVDLNNTLYKVNTKTGEMEKFCSEMDGIINSVFSAGDKIILLTDQGIQLADCETGSLLTQDKTLQDTVGAVNSGAELGAYPVVFTSAKDKDSIVYANHSGIFYHNINGNTVEQLVNGEIVSLADNSMSFQTIISLDDSHYMVFVTGSLGANRCFVYSYDADASASPNKQLHIYALEDSYVLQQTIAAFQKENPDVFVKKTIGMTGDNGVTAEDAIKSLNTEIMAGNGPDILVLDGLPVDSYIEKGILANISGEVQEVEKKDGFFDNIVQPYQQKGEMYQIPLRFFCTVAEGENQALAQCGNLDQIVTCAKSLKAKDKKAILTPMSAESLLRTLYYADSAKWEKQGTNLENGVRKYLEAAKELYQIDNYSEQKHDDGNQDLFYQGQLLGTINYGNTDRLAGNNQLGIGTLTKTSDVQSIYGIEKQLDGDYTLLDSDGEKAFVPFVSLGLSASSAENADAKQFIQTALSSKCQSQMTDGFSINRKAFENGYKNMDEYDIVGESDGQMISYEVNPLNKKQQQKLNQMLESLSKPAITDRVIQELVLTEGEKYLQENQSLEDAVSTIVKKVELYVSE